MLLQDLFYTIFLCQSNFHKFLMHLLMLILYAVLDYIQCCKYRERVPIQKLLFSQSLPSQKRQFSLCCYQFVFHSKVYTQSNCIFECSIEYAKMRLYQTSNDSCIPWYYPSSDDNIEFCDPWQTINFFYFMNDEIPDDTCAKCLPGM